MYGDTVKNTASACRSRSVAGINADIIMRKIAGPDGSGCRSARQFYAYCDITLLHHALTIILLVIGIASAVLRHPDIIQKQVEHADIEVHHSSITDGREDTPPIRGGG